MAQKPGSEHERLAVLVGRWVTRGRTQATMDAPAAPIEGVDTYEWLPGGFGLLHVVDARVGDVHVEGAEIIGWDPARNAYSTPYFGSDGPNSYDASLGDEEGALVWTMRSRTDRFRGRFSDNRSTIAGRWEQLDAEDEWRPWMEVTLTRAVH
jgi:Protein of unknown function (DUF1579)